MSSGAATAVVAAVALWAVVPIFLAAYIASGKGRSWIGGAIVGAFLGWLGVGIILLLSTAEGRRAPLGDGAARLGAALRWFLSSRVVLAAFALIVFLLFTATGRGSSNGASVASGLILTVIYTVLLWLLLQGAGRLLAWTTVALNKRSRP